MKFSVSLPGTGGLARFWKEPCTAALVAHVRGRGRGRPIVDLLPSEHAAAFDWAVVE